MIEPYVSTATLERLLPEIVLVGTATLIYVAGAFVKSRAVWAWVAGAGLIAAAICVYWQGTDIATATAEAQRTSLLADGLMDFIRWLSLGVGVLLLLASAQGAAEGQAAEYVGSLLIAVAGAMLVAGAADLVTLFLSLEMVSIPTYVLLYLGRRDAASQESAAKYFYLSILSSAVMLYGFSFLYGVGGSMHLADIHEQLASNPSDWLALTGVAFVLVLAGLGFKMAVVPFHFYAPDVYQGTTHANAAVLALLPKVAGVAALARLVSVFEGSPGMDIAWVIVLILAAATMTLGNVLGLWQDNLRRLLAYSSIAHAGYLLIGVAVAFAARTEGLRAGFDGLQATFFYLIVYSLATIGSFALLGHLGSHEQQLDEVQQLSGLGYTRPGLALALAVLLLSLAGMPPLAGFLGKLTLFYSAVGLQSPEDSRLTVSFVMLAVVGALNAAIAAGYYLRVMAVMYFGASSSRPQGGTGRGALTAAMASLVLTIVLGLFPSSAMRSAAKAAQSLDGSAARTSEAARR